MIRQQQQPFLPRRHSSIMAAAAVGTTTDHDDDDHDHESNHLSDDVLSLDSLESDIAAAAVGNDNDDDDTDPLLGRDLNTTDLAREETRAVSRLRGAVLMVLAFAAVMVAGTVYANTRKTQVQNFTTAFDDASQQLVQAFSLQRRLETMDALAVDMTMYAAAAAGGGGGSNTNATITSSWPAVTMREFARRAMSTTGLMDVSRVWWLPLVTEQTRTLWEDFAIHHTEWTQQDMVLLVEEEEEEDNISAATAVTKPIRCLQDTNNHNNNNNSTVIAPHIFDADGVLPPTAPGPFAPLWQMAPLELNLLQWVNFNVLSLPSWKYGLEAVLHDRKAVVSEEIVQQHHHHHQTPSWKKDDDDDAPGSSAPSFGLRSKATSNDIAEPYSQIFYPVLDEVQNNNDNTTVVAILAFEASWKYYLQNVLPPSAHGLIAVIENECSKDSTFTYEINGEQVQYMGIGDKHQARYHHWHASQVLNVTNPVNGNSNFNTDYCPYTLHVYPSAAMRDRYLNHQPIIYAILVSLIFLFATMVFAVYDCLVEERQKVVMTQALRSTAIVSSLFPEGVRERLFRRNSLQSGITRRNEAVSAAAAATTAAAALSGAGSSNHWEESTNADDNSFVLFDSAKNRLRSFLDTTRSNVDDTNHGCTSRRSSANSLSGLVADPPILDHHATYQPIADSFPNCTVLFADIAGFTAWSSLREPAQVFTLLESVYQTFDKIARKRGVFKVETVGDSYVAVTGLPNAQEDHALIMCRFARDCRHVMREITRKLERSLGPDTCDLRMRFGLHSGPVTAGVLRGEKSRFQLFGDTVNTAARMESTGQKDKIQLSEATAEYLREAGKGHWIVAREELVHAKGKGQLQTYWFEPQNSRRSISSMCSEDSSWSKHSAKSTPSAIWGQDEGNTFDLESYRNKHFRLVEYNVDVLAQLLKQVVARRKMMQLAGLVESNDEQPPVNFYSPSEDERDVIDEVHEVFQLPKFDPRAFKEYVDPESIELSEEVMSQLKRYVTIIGAMYRNNPFHNFEHASHVTMSVSKLLQRVVSPEIRARRRSLVCKDSNKTEKMASDLHAYTHGITYDPLTQFAVVFAALIHDVDHWGVSNAQLIKEGTRLAQQYKNRSVAEQNSVNVAWALLMNPDDYGDLQKVIFPTEDEYKRFRIIVVNLVMSTDIFEPEMQELQAKRWAKAFEPGHDGEPDRENFKATVVIEHIMQASDVAHAMQHWQVYQKWNRRLFDELYTAYKAGRCAKDPATFWVEGEKKFLESYVIPLAKKLKDCGVFGVASDECLNYAQNNRREWETKGDGIVAELVSNFEQREEEERQRKVAEEMNAANGINSPNGKKRRQRFARRRSLFTSGLD